MFHLSSRLVESIQQDRMREAEAARAARRARRHRGRGETSAASSGHRPTPTPARLQDRRDTFTGFDLTPDRLVDLGWRVTNDGFEAHQAEVETLASVAIRRGVPAGIVAALLDPRTPDAPRHRALAALVAFLLTSEVEPATAGVAC